MSETSENLSDELLKISEYITEEEMSKILQCYNDYFHCVEQMKVVPIYQFRHYWLQGVVGKLYN